MDAWIGWIIAGASALAIGVMTVVHYLSWRAALPKRYHRGVGILFERGALDPWAGLEKTIDAIVDTLRIEYPSLDLQFWIRVVPPDGKVEGTFKPDVLAADSARLRGTVDVYTAFLGIYRRPIAVVRQIRDDIGRILPADRSALVHEVAEHIVPYATHGTWNDAADREPIAYSALPWRALAKTIESRVNSA